MDECRICLQCSEEPVISPCAGCRGSSAAVHFSCVEAFYRSRQSWWDLSCPTCKHDYQGRPAMDLGRLGLHEMEQSRGKDHPDVAVLLTNLSNIYGAAGDASQQRDLLERALVIKERKYGQNHRSVANTLTNLGNAYGDLGNAEKKRVLLERALAIKERELGPEHQEVSVTLTNLGNAYGDLGDLERKRDMLQRALSIKEREYGVDHCKVAVTLANLGNAYGSLGDVRKQRDLLLRSLAIEQREYGNNHIEVAITLTSLAQAQGAMGDYSASEVASVRALQIARGILQSPNALLAEMEMFAAVAASAAGRASYAYQTWQTASQQLSTAVGDVTAKAKLQTFTAHALCSWRAAARHDVANWLVGIAGMHE